MRRAFASAGVLGLACVLSATTIAQETNTAANTAADLARFCSMDDPAFCYGFINGAGQFYEALVTYDGVDINPFVCPGREVTRTEATAIFLDWLAEHPESSDELAVDVLFRAWVAAFPCDGEG